MKVRELIELLQTKNSDIDVVLSGYEGGYNDVRGSHETVLAVNVNVAWYYGPHEALDSIGLENPEQYETKQALILF